MGSGSFPGVKRPGRGIDHPPSSSAVVKERVELYLYSPSGLSWPVLGWTLPLPFIQLRRGTDLYFLNLFSVVGCDLISWRCCWTLKCSRSWQCVFWARFFLDCLILKMKALWYFEISGTTRPKLLNYLARFFSKLLHSFALNNFTKYLDIFACVTVFVSLIYTGLFDHDIDRPQIFCI